MGRLGEDHNFSWTPESGEIRIHFEPDVKSSLPAAREAKPQLDPVADLVRS
jgi:hypothetical protein